MTSFIAVHVPAIAAPLAAAFAKSPPFGKMLDLSDCSKAVSPVSESADGRRGASAFWILSASEAGCNEISQMEAFLQPVGHHLRIR
ncbi:MAG: hypothetical protein AAGF50_09855 [Pseudomonadota bacterium]